MSAWFHCTNHIYLFIGFGENCRVLEWIFDRVDNKDVALESPVGYIPKPGSINIEGLGELDMDTLMSIPKDYWQQEIQSIRKYYEEQFNEDLPPGIWQELDGLEKRINSI